MSLAVPTTVGEHITVIIGMFFGAGAFAYLIGVICGILGRQDEATANYNHGLEKLNYFAQVNAAFGLMCTSVMRTGVFQRRLGFCKHRQSCHLFAFISARNICSRPACFEIVLSRAQRSHACGTQENHLPEPMQVGLREYFMACKETNKAVRKRGVRTRASERVIITCVCATTSALLSRPLLAHVQQSALRSCVLHVQGLDAPRSVLLSSPGLCQGGGAIKYPGTKELCGRTVDGYRTRGEQ